MDKFITASKYTVMSIIIILSCILCPIAAYICLLKEQMIMVTFLLIVSVSSWISLVSMFIHIAKVLLDRRYDSQIIDDFEQIDQLEQ